jgi:hypothetical protein
MIELLQDAKHQMKEDPTEFFGSLLVLSLTFAGLYVSMWIFY